MLECGQPMFLLVVNSNGEKGILRPGKVIESATETFAAKFDGKMPIAVGLETLVYGDVRGKFFQQGATLLEIQQDGENQTHHFTRSGEPVSAEKRQTFRVSVALAEVQAKLNRQQKCQVVDFSPEGLAIIAAPGLSMGSTVDISLVQDAESLVTTARVQTVRALAGDKMRYGLLVAKKEVNARRTLLKLTMLFQRTQLKRLAGAA